LGENEEANEGDELPASSSFRFVKAFVQRIIIVEEEEAETSSTNTKKNFYATLRRFDVARPCGEVQLAVYSGPRRDFGANRLGFAHYSVRVCGLGECGGTSGWIFFDCDCCVRNTI
jgi:hypothetical protein